MNGPAVSVLATAYNRARYLPASLESVLAQRFTDFELLVVDDGSTDGTLDIARKYERLDDRVRVVVNDRNFGQFANRNHAARLARAPLLKYHDSDDVMYPHCLEVMVAAIQSVPDAGAALSQGRAWPGGPCPMVLTPELAFTREFLGHGVFQCGPGGALIRKTAFEAVGGFRDVGIHSDYLLWFDIARRFPIVLAPADLFWYREHEGQQLREAQAAFDYARLNGEVWRSLRDRQCPLSGHALERAKVNQTYTVVKQLWRDLKRGRLPLAAYRIRHAGLTPIDWLRYLRPPARSPLAGTPLEGGEVAVPEWVRARRESTRV